jgi:hypothetical protein
MTVEKNEEQTGRSGVSRRRFMGGVGAGAGALAGSLIVGPAAAEVAEGEFSPLATSPQRFGRLFPQLPTFAPATNQVKSALIDMGRPGGLLDARDPLEQGPINLITNPALSANNRDNPFHTAGTTFLGQFLDHDMTFDAASPLGTPTEPEASVNTRTPSFDLDSVYGAGPNGSPTLYDPADRAKLRIGSTGRFEDVPRTANAQAVIADPRNDEHAIIAGLQSAFIKLHNRMVDQTRAATPGLAVNVVFERARRVVTWHYQWIILHEFLPQIIGPSIVQQILQQGRQFYLPAVGQAFIPVEFQGAAYRFGHSMVRPSYRLNLAGNADNSPFFGFIFDPSQEGRPDPDDLRGGARAPRRFVGWQTFFNFGDGAVRPNKRIDTKLSTPLFNLPLGAIASGDPPTSLPQRNLLRQLTWSIPSGQAIGHFMRVPTLEANSFPELAQFGNGLQANTPLWYYILKEAEVVMDGLTLGPVGQKIVGEVFIGLLQVDVNGFLRVQPSWTPTLPSQTPGRFTMVDLLRNAGVDPASRGQ